MIFWREIDQTVLRDTAPLSLVLKARYILWFVTMWRLGAWGLVGASIAGSQLLDRDHLHYAVAGKSYISTQPWTACRRDDKKAPIKLIKSVGKLYGGGMLITQPTHINTINTWIDSSTHCNMLFICYASQYLKYSAHVGFWGMFIHIKWPLTKATFPHLLTLW